MMWVYQHMVIGELNHFQYMELILWLIVLMYLEKVMVSLFLLSSNVLEYLSKIKNPCIGASIRMVGGWGKGFKTNWVRCVCNLLIKEIFSCMNLNLMQICTIPLDTAKVRLQLQKKSVAGDGLTLPKYEGMLGTVATIGREEGLSRDYIVIACLVIWELGCMNQWVFKSVLIELF